MDRTRLLDRGVIATALATGAAALGLAAGGIVSTGTALEAATAPRIPTPATATQNVEFQDGAGAEARRTECPDPRERRHHRHGMEL